MAHIFLLDASALAKRYVPEPGSALVHSILDTVPGERIQILNIGAAEIVSILVRKRNASLISQPYFEQALINFDKEIVSAAEITKLSITNRLIIRSFELIVAHSINATDALVLQSAVAIARRWSGARDELVLVTSDQRLLRAAEAEGLTIFDPETANEAELAALIRP